MKLPRVWLVAIAALLLGLCTLGLFVYDHLKSLSRETPQFLKKRLIEDVGKQSSIEFDLPRGDIFALALGFPAGTSDLFISGTLTVSNGIGRVVTMKFDLREAQRANWLHDESLNAYILASSEDEFAGVLLSGTTQHLRIEFDRGVSTSGSLWLTYVQHSRSR